MKRKDRMSSKRTTRKGSSESSREGSVVRAGREDSREAVRSAVAQVSKDRAFGSVVVGSSESGEAVCDGSSLEPEFFHPFASFSPIRGTSSSQNDSRSSITLSVHFLRGASGLESDKCSGRKRLSSISAWKDANARSE